MLKKLKVKSQRGVSVLEMHFDLNIFLAKRAKIVYKLFLLFANPRPRRVLDLIRCHVHANA